MATLQAVILFKPSISFPYSFSFLSPNHSPFSISFHSTRRLSSRHLCCTFRPDSVSSWSEPNDKPSKPGSSNAEPHAGAASDMSINADQDKASWRTDEEVMSLYEEWLVKNGKVYNALEKKKRFQIFKDNLRCIDKINAENRGYTSGLNAFSDMTYEEFRTSMLMFQKDASFIEKEVMSLYEEWLMKHSKSYNALEKEKRFQIFKDNLQYMQYMGRKNRSYNLELNQFADMTNVEFCASVLMFQKIKKTSFTDEEAMSLYEKWLIKHGKLYNALEKEKRFQIFKDNLRYMDPENRSYNLELNQFADLTNEEFRASVLMFQKIKEALLTEEEAMSLYEEWLMKHGKSYNELEKKKRFQIFKDNVRYMDPKSRSHKLEVDEFADLTYEEFSNPMLMFQKFKEALDEKKKKTK